MVKSKPTLPEAIDFERDIAPYPLTMIYAGVGSGKSTFAGFLMTGNKKYHIPVKTVLLITSRRAKVAETLMKEHFYLTDKIGNFASMDALSCFGFPQDTDIYVKKLSDGTVVQINAVCTNAYIENYLKYVYDPNDETTHICNRFDVIIWDEVHSLITDSTYQSAPFHVMRLIEETYDRIIADRENMELPEEHRDDSIFSPRCKNIICMTGTPECFEGTGIFDHAHIIDRRAECRSVQPRNIHFISNVQAQRQIREQIQANERGLYFANHITQAEEAARKYDCPRDAIAVLYSDQKRQNELRDSEDNLSRKDFECMQKTQMHLEKHSCIPDNILLVITTSKNKEGININNDDIRHVYIEAHGMTDIVQMAGRLRIGAEHVYIIIDSAGHGGKESSLEDYASRQMFNPEDLKDEKLFPEVINRHLQEYCEHCNIPDMVGNPQSSFRPYMQDADSHIADYISLQMSKYAYAQFDHFTQKFMYNCYRSFGNKFARKEEALFQRAIQNPYLLKKIFQNQFPDCIVHELRSKEEEACEYIENYIAQNSSSFITEEDKITITIALARIIDGNYNPDKNYQLNRLLKSTGFKIMRVNNEKSHKHYNFYKFVPHRIVETSAS